MNHIKSITLVFSLIVLGACSSPYKPTSKVKNISASLSQANALKIIKEALYTKKNSGICNAHEWRVDYKKGQALSVNKKGFALNVIKRGSLIGSEYFGAGAISTQTVNFKYQQVPERKMIKFSDFEWIRIIRPGSMAKTCHPAKGSLEVRFKLNTTRAGDYFAIAIEMRKLDKLLAALIKIVPNVPLQTT